MKNKVSASLVIGIILVIIALGYVGDVCEVWDFRLFFPGWWTLFIIVPAGVSLLSEGVNKGDIVRLVIGVLLLLWRLEIIPPMLAKLIAPLLLLALGFTIIFRGRLYGSGGNYIAIFGGRAPSFEGKLFDGAFCTAIFGGVDIKLKNARIVDGAVIDAVAIFGGVDVKLPEGVNATVTGIPIFGGIGEPKNRTNIEGAPTVKVNAVAVFGGVDVK